MRRFGCAARTSGAAGDGEASQVEGDQESVTINAVEADVGRIGSSRSAGAVDVRVGNAVEDRIFKPVPKGSFVGPLFGPVVDNPLRGRAEGDCPGDIFSPGPAVTFVMSAVEKRRQHGALADVQRADAFGGVKLVPAYRVQVDAEFLHVNGNLAGGLDAVRMQSDAGIRGDFRDF